MLEGEEFIEQLLTNIMEDIKKEMRGNGQYSSGETERLWEVKLLSSGKFFEGVLLGPSYIQALITGRGPTRAGGSSGDQTLQQKIFDWIRTKGITPNEANMSQESLSWAISKHMHKHGNKLFQDRKDTKLLENNITESRINAAVDSFVDQQVDVLIDFNKIFK